MIKTCFTTILILFLGPLLLYGQNTISWGLDGAIYVKIKNDYPLNIAISENGDLDVNSLYFLKDIVEKYEITRVYKSFYFTNDRDLLQTLRVEFDRHHLAPELIRFFDEMSFVDYAEPVPYLVKCLTPNDLGPSSGQFNQWGLHRINAQQAWDISTGDSSIVVAIVDDAVQTTHVDLADNMLPGRDVANNNNNPNPPSTQFNHGTHVAGIAGAVTDNGVGIASIGWNISILPVKATNTSTNITHGYEGVAWAANNGANVINMSWGGANPSQTAINVVNAAFNNGIVLVAAAGNSGHQGNPVFYPAAYNSVIAVANTTTTDAKATSSQYGSWIDVSAPGTQILSTVPFSGYQSFSGTSMSSPLVAGLCGLMLSLNPNLTPTEIKNCLTSSADNIDTQNPNFVGLLGAGRINAYQAMQCVSATVVPLDAGISVIKHPRPTVCQESIVPEIVLRNFGVDTLTSVDIKYKLNNGPLNTYNWSGVLPTHHETTVILTSMTVTPGKHTFTVYTENPNAGQDGNNTNDTSFTVFNHYDTIMVLPFTENFESGSFDTNNWSVHNPDNDIGWQIVNTQGTTPGNQSAKMEHYYYTAIGQRNSMLTPPLDFTGYAVAELSFEHAYRRYDQSSTDSLIIYVSTDCGETFPYRVFAGGENGTGSFATASTSVNPFTPSASADWCLAGSLGASCFTVNLTPFVGYSSVIIKFESYNSYQNNLFIDNIQIYGDTISNQPIADFEASSMQVYEGQGINFTDMSLNNPDSWTWTFSGGTPTTSSLPNPFNIVYNNAGVYDVTLEVGNFYGTDTKTKTSFITVIPNPHVPEVNFSANMTTVMQDHSVNFTDLTTNNPTDWLWHFEGGTPNTSTLQNPTAIHYHTPGVYNVSLTASNNNGPASLTKDAYITVLVSSSLEDLSTHSGIFVYPNPATDKLFIHVDKANESPLLLRMYNLLGKEMFNKEINHFAAPHNSYELDISAFESGLYMLETRYKGFIRHHKVIIH